MALLITLHAGNRLRHHPILIPEKKPGNLKKPFIEFINITKQFGNRTILDHVNVSIYKGEITAIIGKSGVGKSVFLKHIIGLIKPDSGEILYNGRPLNNMSRSQWIEFKRSVSYMFQQNALFDSLTVFENIALPLRERTRMKENEIIQRVGAKLEQFELSEVNERYPSQISGGMQKRVALARALITEPEIILFDEPTTGLDPLRKNAVLTMIAHHQRKIGFTAVMVSHDIPDVFFIANRVAIIEDRKVPFQGTPLELEQSENEIVRQFIRGQESLKDELTGLLTRQEMERLLRAELARMGKYQTKLTLILFTIDDLKKVREKIGYILEQRIVQCMGMMLKKHFGMIGTSARYGSSSIITVLPHTDCEHAEKLLKSLREEMRQMALFKAEQYPRICVDLSVSAGIACADSTVSMNSLFKEAEKKQHIMARLSCSGNGVKS